MLAIVGLSPFNAILWCLFLGILYVGTLYIWRFDKDLRRNHPKQVKNRFISLSIASVLSLLLLRFVLCKKDTFVREGFLDITGLRLWSGAFLMCFVGLLHVATLFLGPLALRFLDNDWSFDIDGDTDFYQHRSMLDALKYYAGNIYWWRTFVVGPGSEELVFRACMCPVLQRAGFSRVGICFLAPMFFGVAHLHHYYELRKTYPAKKAALGVLFQFCYTYFFGVYACFLFMKTKCIYACILAHAFCNYMGFPDLDALVEHKHKNILRILYVGGIVGFYLLFKII